MTEKTTGATAPRTSDDLLGISPVIPVVQLDDVEQAVPLARALVRGGIGIIEVTLRTEAGLPAIRRIASEVPEIVTGAGTVTTPEQAAAAVDAGATFLVTPGSPPALLNCVVDLGLPLLAGVSTLTEVMTLLERGLTAMKFFPAEAAGGPAYLKAAAGPLPHVRFCPTGGISVANAPDYLALPNVGCVGGSWLAPREALRAGHWAEVERRAAGAAALRG